MTARAHFRGWEIYHDGVTWRFSDTNEHANMKETERPCKRCGKFPTKEGYDACLGYLPGVVHACCGHGVAEPVIIKE